MAKDALSDFTSGPFSHNGETRTVYWKGSGPAVVVMSEIPGITPEVANFARRVVDEGFSVAMPVLFGDPGREPSTGYMLKSIARACVAKEFVALATNKTAPVTEWLRGLVAEAHQRAGVGEGVGVVGMCFTGGFGLALAVDPLVQVPVLSQPSMPFGLTGKQKKDMGIAPADLTVVQERVAQEDLCVIGLRFTGDPLVPSERFARYRETLGEGFLAVEIDSSSGNQHGIDKKAHSVLTEEYRDVEGHPTLDAHRLVIDHFKERLGGST